MEKKFIIGDRIKSEWVSALDVEKKHLEFDYKVSTAKEYDNIDDAKAALKALQETGYFSDLQVYIKEGDGNAYKYGERDYLQN